MTSAAGDTGWSEFHKRFAVQGLPQIPDEALAARYRQLIAGRDQRVLLLGITRVLASLGCGDHTARLVEPIAAGLHQPDAEPLTMLEVLAKGLDERRPTKNS